MCKFLQIYKLLQLTKEEIEKIENQKRPITNKKTELAMFKLPTMKSSGSSGFTGKFLSNIQRRTYTHSCQTLPKK